MENQFNSTQSFSLPSSSSLLGETFSFYTKHWQIIFGILSIPVGIGLLGVLTREVVEGLEIIFGIVGFVAGFLARIALFAAIAENGEPTDGVRGAYQRGWKHLAPFLWISGLVTLATLGGFFLFVIPGIMLAVALGFSLFILFSEEKQGLPALAASWSYVKGRWFSVFGRLLVFWIFITLMATVISTFMYGPVLFSGLRGTGLSQEAIKIPIIRRLLFIIFNNFSIVPLAIIYPFFIYRALKENKKANEESPENLLKIQKTIKSFMVFGLVVLVVATIVSMFFVIKFLPQFTFLPHVFPSALGAFLPASPLFDLLFQK